MFFLVIIFILFLFFSCLSEIVKKTHWEGSIDGDFDSSAFKDDHDLEIYINNDNTCRIVIIFNFSDGSKYDCGLSGDYTLDNNNYAFTADVEADDGEIQIEFDGILNTTTGVGNGDLTLTKWYSADPDADCDWEVTKIY